MGMPLNSLSKSSYWLPKDSRFWMESPKMLKLVRKAHPTAFYFQNPSSSIPVEWMDFKNCSAEAVLDMCASPGSKTIQILENARKGKVMASEINVQRFRNLSEYTNLGLLHENRKRLTLSLSNAAFPNLKYNNYFDNILLDAPCSGEGIISALMRSSWKGWNRGIVLRNVKLQQRLLDSAFKQLKPGGQLVYSTCTLNPYENEEQVAHFLQKYPEMNLEAMPEQFERDILTSIAKIGGGDYDDTPPFIRGFSYGCFDLSQTLRVLPSAFYEGFFVARFRKAS